MAGFKMDMAGLDKVLAKLDVKKFEQEIEGELHAFGLDVKRDAQDILARDLKYSNGGLNTHIFSVPGDMSVKIIATKDYAAYVEFGTGRFAALYVPSIEPEWQEYARSFYINGQGRMRPTPFLYPAFEKNKIELIKRLKNLLNA